MSHDEAFAAMQARKTAEAAAAPARVTWRKVSDLTGGGYSGLGRDGRLAWVANHGGAYAYGVVTDDGIRIRVNATVAPLTAAKKRASVLVAHPVPALSTRQRAVLELLCAATRAGSDCITSETGAGPSTLAGLISLDLILATAAGAREKLYHLTDLGRATILCAVNDDSEGGPTMTEIEIIDAPDTAAPTADAPAKKRSRGRKDGELANVAAPAKKAAGPSPEMKKLYKDTVTAVKGVAGRGAKTAEKLKYLRIGDSNGKTVAYVNFPTSKSVLVEVPRVGSTGYDTVSVKEEAHVADAVAVVTAYVKARDEAAAAKAAAANA